VERHFSSQDWVLTHDVQKQAFRPLGLTYRNKRDRCLKT
jgi:hypothetical protein